MSKKAPENFDSPEGRDWIKSLLRDDLITDLEITFIKKDGTERLIRPTLSESVIPAEKQPKGTGKAKADDTIAVFDKDKQEWRSMRYDSIKRVEFSIG